MQNIVVKGTKKRYKGKWVAGVNTSRGFYWIICEDHDQAIHLATAAAIHQERARRRLG